VRAADSGSEDNAPAKGSVVMALSQLLLVRRGRYGGMLPLIVIVLTVMIAMAVLAVDFGHVTLAKTELRAAVDAACLSGSTGLAVSPAEARARAKAIALTNTVNGSPVVLEDSDIELGTWDATTKEFVLLTGAAEAQATAVRIKGQLTSARGSSIGLTFAPVFGQASKDLTVTAVAGFAHGADVVLVQDITSSFSDELSDAKVADQDLVDYLYNNGTGKSMLGIAVHTGWGSTLAPLQMVSSNYTFLTNKVTAIKLCGNTGMPVCSGTDIAAGLAEGIKIFNDSNYVALNSKAGKVIVLVSDGEPTSSANGSHPGLTGAQMLALAQTEADNAWARQIHVYVVFFNRDNSATAADNVKTLIRGKGVFLQTTDASQLPALIELIAKQLPMQLLK
jgi:Flp pilus assembly protein TadG